MDAATQTPCSLDIDTEDTDIEITKSLRLPNFLDTPQSISSTSSQSWLLNHHFSSPWSEYNQQQDQPIYLNDDRLVSSPDPILIAPLYIDDSQQLPQAPPECQNMEPTDDPEKFDRGGLPMAMLDFFSIRNHFIQPLSPILNREHLDKLLLSDLPIILDMSAPNDSDSLLPNTSLPVPMPANGDLFIPSVITDHADPERPFTCERCYQKYTRPQDCTRHIKSAHIKTKYFICHQVGCEASFSRSDVLKRHIRHVHRIPNK